MSDVMNDIGDHPCMDEKLTSILHHNRILWPRSPVTPEGVAEEYEKENTVQRCTKESKSRSNLECI